MKPVNLPCSILYLHVGNSTGYILKLPEMTEAISLIFMYQTHNTVLPSITPEGHIVNQGSWPYPVVSRLEGVYCTHLVGKAPFDFEIRVKFKVYGDRRQTGSYIRCVCSLFDPSLLSLLLRSGISMFMS